MAISWPNVIKDKGGIRAQFQYMIDIVPTILEATRIKAPTTVNGIKQAPIEGVTMMYSFEAASANAPSRRTTQYFEMGGYRGIYHDGWYPATTPPISPWSPVLGVTLPDVITGYKWELYNLTEDYSQANDLAAKYPDKLKDLQKVFVQEAKKYQVFPLDNRAFVRVITPRPSATTDELSSSTPARFREFPAATRHHSLGVRSRSPLRSKCRRLGPKACTLKHFSSTPIAMNAAWLARASCLGY
jgi:hypothetical protein